MYYRELGWLDNKNKDKINNIIITKLKEEEQRINSPIINPFLTININDIKLPMIRQLTDKFNLITIFDFINEGNVNKFDKNIIPYFSDSHIEAANILLIIADRCAIEIIMEEVKNEHCKYMLLTQFVEHDICLVIANIFIITFFY